MKTVRFLLDTNLVSHLLKGRNSQLDAHVRRIPPACLGISAVTEGELRFGVARLPQATRLASLVEEFLAHTIILPWDSVAARQYAKVRALLEQRGTPMANLDLMIAAHALSQDLILVTNDHAFARVEGLEVRDWTR